MTRRDCNCALVYSARAAATTTCYAPRFSVSGGTRRKALENQNKPRTQHILQNPEMAVHLKRFGAAEAYDQNGSNDSG